MQHIYFLQNLSILIEIALPLNLKPFILEDEDEDKQRMLCFIPVSQHVHLFKNNNKRLKLTVSSSSISRTSDCIHTPKKYLTIDDN